MSDNIFFIERTRDNLAQFNNFQKALTEKSTAIIKQMANNSREDTVFIPVAEIKAKLPECRILYRNMLEFYDAYNADKADYISETDAVVALDINSVISKSLAAFVLCGYNLSTPSFYFVNLTPTSHFDDLYIIFKWYQGISEFVCPPVLAGDFNITPGTQVNPAGGIESDVSAALNCTKPSGNYTGTYIALGRLCKDGETPDFIYTKVTDIDKWVSVNGTRCASVSVDTENQSIMDSVWKVGDTVRVTNFYNESFITTITAKNTTEQTLTFADSQFAVTDVDTVNLYVKSVDSPAYTVDIPVSDSLKKVGSVFDTIECIDGVYKVKRMINSDFTVKSEPTYEVFDLSWQTSLSTIARLNWDSVLSINSVAATVVKDESGALKISGNSKDIGNGVLIGAGDSRDGQLCSVSRLDGASQEFIMLTEDIKI